MFWKNWPYWLKGGMRGAMWGLIFAIIFFFMARNGGGFMNFGFAAAMIMLAFLPTFLFFMVFSVNIFDVFNALDRQHASPELILLLGLIATIIYFIIGAIIGLIYGKIKNKK